MKRPATLAAAGLAGLAGLHVAWAAGSSWPLPDKAALSDAVIGHDTFPSAAACLVVAGALTARLSFRCWPSQHAHERLPARAARPALIGALAVRGESWARQPDAVSSLQHPRTHTSNWTTGVRAPSALRSPC